MKKLIIAAIAAIALSSCKKEYPVKGIREVNTTAPLLDEHLMNDVEGGLHRITLDDSTVILIYRGTESCTMIQIK
jgi:hypothetical protein